MGKRTTTNTIIIVVTFIIVVFAVILLIQQVEANVFFWLLRPSEATAMDIVGRTTVLGSSVGEIQVEYKNITGVDFYIHKEDKLVCVIVQKTGGGSKPLTTINCYSLPFDALIEDLSTDAGFTLCLEKKYDTVNDKVKVETKWEECD